MNDSLFQDFACDWSCGKGHQKISVSAQIEVTGKKVEISYFSKRYWYVKTKGGFLF